MRPDCLVAGEISRLIPAVSESNKEIRLLSPVLAALRIVPTYAKQVLEPVGVRLGVRSRIECYSEIVFKGSDFKGDRPDGLIVVDNGRTQWRAIIEAKHGKNQLGAKQIERYLDLAKQCGVDAVITISNQMTALATHSPVEVSPKLTRKVELYHLAWSHIRTNVSLLLQSGDVTDSEQTLVLSELERYLQHSSSGIEGFTQMNAGWRDLTARLRAGSNASASDIDVLNTATDWIEEQRDMCLLLSRTFELKGSSQPQVSLKLPRAHAESQDVWRQSIAKMLVSENRLSSEIIVEGAAAPIDIETRIAGRVFIPSMKLSAPKDKKSTSARVNWLLRQIAKTEDARIQIEINWPGKKEAIRLPLSAIREEPQKLRELDEGTACNSVSVLLVEELSGRFSSRKNFISAIETALLDFYREAGQHLKPWQSHAPRTAKPKDVEAQKESEDLAAASGDGVFVDIPDHLM